jgi:putative transcriptional regulator
MWAVVYHEGESMGGGKGSMRLDNQLKRCRFDRDDMSQEALAKAIGVTRQTIISIEKGYFVPSTVLALKLARFFGRPVEEIFQLVDDGRVEKAGKKAG